MSDKESAFWDSKAGGDGEFAPRPAMASSAMGPVGLQLDWDEIKKQPEFIAAVVEVINDLGLMWMNDQGTAKRGGCTVEKVIGAQRAREGPAINHIDVTITTEKPKPPEKTKFEEGMDEIEKQGTEL